MFTLFDTPIIEACQFNQAYIASLLVSVGSQNLLIYKQGICINCKDALGRTPLHYACKEGHSEIAKALVVSHAYVA